MAATDSVTPAQTISPDWLARIRVAEAHLARREYRAAFDIVDAAVKGGVVHGGVFLTYRRLFNVLHGRDLPHAEIFDFIYASDGWEGGSGAGSTPQATAPYRAFLKDFMADNGISSVVDAGCGDWQSSQLIDWTGVDYVGIDVSAVVLNNTRRFAKAGVRFLLGDARTMELPQADLLILKDVLQHWSNADIVAAIPKFRRFRYCIVANGATEQVKNLANSESVAGGYRPVDLALPPFSLAGRYVLSYEVPYVTRANGAVCSEMRVFLIERDR
jgi:SAM-dependent methyltransferase